MCIQIAYLGSWENQDQACRRRGEEAYNKYRRMCNIQQHDGPENTPFAVPDGEYPKRAEYCGHLVELKHRWRARE